MPSRKVWWIYEICGVRESVQDIWQGHLHTRPADLHQPKDHARNVRIVSVWILIYLKLIPKSAWGAVEHVFRIARIS